jgi:uncharacterized protein YjiS (DUF1127 family)
MPSERSGIDPANWKALAPARQSALTRPSLEFQRASAGRHLWRAIRSAWMRYLRHRQRQLDLAQLAAMNDFELKDIGISRDQIRAALWDGTDLPSERRKICPRP